MNQHGTKRSHSASSVKGSSVMPLYFFHLNFGQRVVPDEEGVELRSRSAARDEALAAVRELVNPEVAGSQRRWAGWFVEVADEMGGFFRTPIGQPALEIVTPDYLAPGAEEPELKPVRLAATALPVDASVRARMAEIVRQRKARQQCTAQLLRDNKQLRRELSSIYHTCKNIGVRTSRLVLLARRVTLAPLVAAYVLATTAPTGTFMW